MRGLRWSLLLLLIVTIASVPSQADDIDYHSKTLPNGLKVIYKYLSGAKIVTARVVVPVGMLDEPRRLRGISHLLEHLIYRGNHRYNPADFHREIDDQGGTYNGLTTLDRTEYFMIIPPAQLPKALPLYLDMIAHPGLTETNIALEKKIIHIENEMRNTPGNVFFLYLNALTQQQMDNTLQTITHSDLVQYHNQYYQTSKMTVIITGKFQYPEIEKILADVQTETPTQNGTTPQWQLTASKNPIILEDYLMGEEYQLLFGFDLKQLPAKDRIIAKTLPYILTYESRQYDHLTDRPLDYDFYLLNIVKQNYLLLMYRDPREKFSPELEQWHRKNLDRYFKYLKTKNFDQFLQLLTKAIDKRFEVIKSDAFALNEYLCEQLFDSGDFFVEDIPALRSLTSRDIRNFVQKYLEGASYQTIVVKAL